MSNQVIWIDAAEAAVCFNMKISTLVSKIEKGVLNRTFLSCYLAYYLTLSDEPHYSIQDIVTEYDKITYEKRSCAAIYTMPSQQICFCRERPDWREVCSKEIIISLIFSCV